MSSDPPINLEYAAPRPAPPRGFRPAYLVSRLISSYIAYAVVMAVLVLVVPRFARAFADLKVTVPTMTRLLLAVSRACVNHYLWAALLPLPATWAVVTSWGDPSPTRKRLVRLAAFLFVAAFLCFTILALFTPMRAMIDGLAGSK